MTILLAPMEGLLDFTLGGRDVVVDGLHEVHDALGLGGVTGVV